MVQDARGGHKQAGWRCASALLLQYRVLLFFGDLYPGVLCIVKQVRARYFHMFGRNDLLPEHAEVDLQLEEYVGESINYDSVRNA